MQQPPVQEMPLVAAVQLGAAAVFAFEQPTAAVEGPPLLEASDAVEPVHIIAD